MQVANRADATELLQWADAFHGGASGRMVAAAGGVIKTVYRV